MKKLLRLALVTLFATGAAQAATISSFAAYGPEATDWEPQTLTLQRFNSSLGTLNAVIFEFSGGMRSDFRTINKVNSTQQVSNILGGNVRFVLPTADEFELQLSNPVTFTLGALATDTRSLSDTKDRTETLTDPSSFFAFMGSGTFDIDVYALASSELRGAGNVSGGPLTYATATARVTYDFTAPPASVPEPASLALVGLALSAVALSRRRA